MCWSNLIDKVPASRWSVGVRAAPISNIVLAHKQTVPGRHTLIESVGVRDIGQVAKSCVDDGLGADSYSVGGVRLEAWNLGDCVRPDVDRAPPVHVGRQRQLAVVDTVAGNAVVRRRIPRHLHRRRRRSSHVNVCRHRNRSYTRTTHSNWYLTTMTGGIILLMIYIAPKSQRESGRILSTRSIGVNQ